MRKIAIAITFLLLCACSSMGPDYKRPATSVQERWNVEYEAAADLANTRWWRLFGDPALNRLIEDAVRGNLDLKVAAARVDQYIGAMEAGRSQFFPQIGASYSFSGQNQAGSTIQTQQAALNASWELDLWGRIRRSDEAARAQIAAGEAGRRGVLMTLVANVASGYLTLRGLDRQLEITKATEKAYAESLRLFELRFRHGAVSGLEVAQAQSQHESARQSIPACESQIRLQENLISLLLGRPPGPIPRGKPLDELKPPGIPAGLPSELLERRPDIIQAEQNLIAANAQIGAAKASFFPKISLTGALGVAAGDITGLFAAGASIWSAVGQAATPLINPGAVSGQMKQAEAQQQQALYQYHQAVLTGFKEVEDALVKTAKGREQLEAQQRQVQALEEYARLSRLQLDAGTSSFLQTLDADRSLFSGKLAANQTKYDLLTSIVNVYKAMGGGWVSEAEKLDR